MRFPLIERMVHRDRRHRLGHPSLVQPGGLRLYGRRVVLRPLTSSDFPPWSEVRLRNEAWLTRGSPSLGVDGRPDAQPRSRSRRAAGPRPRAADGRGLRLRSVRRQRLRRRGQPEQRRPRRDCRPARSATGSTGPGPASATSPRPSSCSPGSPSRSSTCTAWRSASCRATPTADG